MMQLKTPLMYLMTLLASVLFTGGASAQSGQSELTQEGQKAFVQGHFESMYKRAANRASDILESGQNVKAFAVVVTMDEEVRTVSLDQEQLDQMPPDVALEILRRSLRAAVEKGGIGGVSITYTADNPNKAAKAEYVLVVEMEHVFGAHLAQLIPYSMKGGNAVFGKPVVADLEPSILRVNMDNQAKDTLAQ